MRAIVTGQVGLDKGPYLEALRRYAGQQGIDLHLCHVGQMMYAEAPDVPPGRILNLPISRLNTLRRAVFKEILRLADRHEHLIVNTHATFRWRHGLFAAFDFDQIKAFNADLYITLLDNAENVHARLMRDHDIDHTLKDIMVWREEELLATEILANILKGHGHFYMMSRGRQQMTIESTHRLMFESHRRKAYLSFPMSHVMDLPDTLAQIDRFKAEMAEHFVTFDPADVDEYSLHMAALSALKNGESNVTVPAAGGEIQLKTAEIAEISGDIMGQIYARDFKMIDQADMIISLVPELPNGKPGLSSGVERELHHAFEGGKEVYVIWACRATPSPFITETATRVFDSTAQALDYFGHEGKAAPRADMAVHALLVWLVMLMVGWMSTPALAEDVRIATYNIENFQRHFRAHALRDVAATQPADSLLVDLINRERAQNDEDNWEIAQVILHPEFSPDILLIQEGCSADDLAFFNRRWLNNAYDTLIVFPGNSERGQHLGIMLKQGFTVIEQRDQYYLERDPTNAEFPLFARGPAFCLIETPGGQRLWIGTTHQKSRYNDSLEATQWRNREAERTRAIMQELVDTGEPRVLMLGDMNDQLGYQGFEEEAGADALAAMIGGEDSGLYLATQPLSEQSAISFGGYWRSQYRSLIDHIIVSEAVRPLVQWVDIHTSDIAAIASDHYPVYIDLRLAD